MSDWFTTLYTEQAREDRRHLRVWVGRVLVLSCALVVTAWATGAYAVPVFKATQGGHPVVLRLLETPCANERVLNHIPQPLRQRFKTAHLTYGGKDWASCWLETPGGVFSVDEEGDQLEIIPRHLFKEEAV